VLTRYWFEFVRGGQATALSLGCGITAYNLDDARRMLRQEIFPLYGDRATVRVLEGVEFASLDERVRLHLGNPTVRGVWFPATPVRGLPRLGKATREQPRSPISGQW
jgi:hypothetical protein